MIQPAEDQDIRNEIKLSMSLPWQKRPFYATKAIDTTPVGVRRDRRSKGLLRSIRRHYWHLSDAIEVFLWLIVAFMVATLGIMCFAGVEALFR